MPYNSVSDLKASFHPGEFLRIFDDNNDGVVADGEPAPEQVMRRAHERLRRALLIAYGGEPPFTEVTAPDSVRVMELEYAIAIARARVVDEKSRREAGELLEALDKEVESMAKGFTALTTDQPSPGPSISVIEDEGPAGTEEASMVRRDSSYACHRSFWRAEKERC
jgi:hypothetical protein